MARFLIVRLLQSIAVLAVMSFVIYGLIGLMPGDPIDVMIASNPNLTHEDAQRLRQLYGLDRPLVERYAAWAGAALQGDFGYSRLYARPVLDVLGPALLNTLRLVGLAFVAALIIGLPLGIWAALRPRSPRDYAVNLLAFAGISIPTFWLGLMLISVFAVILGVLPAGGSGETVGDAGGWWRQARYFILPVATLTVAGLGGYTRHMRAATIEVMRQDYIRTARAKGAGLRRVVFRHALRNALIPVLTILALDLGTLVSGALVTETIFAWPGMGKLIYDAIMGNDYNLALVALLFATLLTLAGNVLADLAYGWLDPRIRRHP